jgi:hypothetical protein
MSDNGLVYPVPDEHRMIIVNVEKDPTWEAKLRVALPPLIEMRDTFYNILKLRFNLNMEPIQRAGS